jgi:hypothetical protein
MGLNVRRLRGKGGAKGACGCEGISGGEQVESALGKLCGSGMTGGVHGASRIMAEMKQRLWRAK